MTAITYVRQVPCYARRPPVRIQIRQISSPTDSISPITLSARNYRLRIGHSWPEGNYDVFETFCSDRYFQIGESVLFFASLTA